MLLYIILAVVIVVSLTIPSIVISVRSAMKATDLETKVTKLDTTVTTLVASQKTQIERLTKTVTDLQQQILRSTSLTPASS